MCMALLKLDPQIPSKKAYIEEFPNTGNNMNQQLIRVESLYNDLELLELVVR